MQTRWIRKRAYYRTCGILSPRGVWDGQLSDPDPSASAIGFVDIKG